MSRIAACGNEKDSDALVTVDLDAPKTEIVIESKLKKMFGKLMKKAVLDALAESNIHHAKVVVKDFGALDFVLKGRTKTAVKRALKEGN